MNAIRKIVRKLEKLYIHIFLFNREKFNNQFVEYLKHCGCVIHGCPGFVSDDVWIDMTAPERITIEDGVIISKGVTLLVHDYSVGYVLAKRDENIKNAMLLKDIVLEKNCFIGANTTILPGTRIGENSIVGAGSVIKGNVPDNVVIAGNPARIVKSVDDYYEKIKKKDIQNITIIGL